MMKNSGKKNHTGFRASRRSRLKRMLSSFLAVSTAITMISGNVTTLMADEPSTEYALAGAGSGQHVTVHFGNGEDQDISIHVNPETNAETLAGIGSEETEVETEAETEAETENVEEKRVYTYEDDKVLVTATLEKADAVPADAVLRVTPVTPDSDGYNYDAYMEALNERASGGQTTETEEQAFTDENTLLYDIAFIVCDYDEDGNPIEGTEREFEPEEGSVAISIIFRKDQLTNDINAESASDIVVGHLPLNEGVRGDSETTKDVTNISKDDISVTPITADKNIEGEQSVAFTTDSFSLYYIGKDTSTKQIQILFKDSDEAQSPDHNAKLRRAYIYVEDSQDPENKHVMIPINLESDNYDRSSGVYTITSTELSQGSLDLTNWDSTYSVEILQQYDQQSDWKYTPTDNKKVDVNQLVTRANEPGLVGMYYFTLPTDNTDLSNEAYQIIAQKVPYSTKAELLQGTTEDDLLKAVLGDAVYYGVTANSYHQKGDTQTNFAVKTFTSDADAGGDLSENPGNIVVGDILDGGKLKIRNDITPHTSTIYYGKQIDSSKIIQDSIQNLVPLDQKVINDYVDGLIRNAKTISSQNPLKLTKTAGNKFYIDTTALPADAVLYITLDESVDPQANDVQRELTDLKKAVGNSDQLCINKLPGQTIVFQTSEDLNINQMLFDNGGTFSFNNTVSDKAKSDKNRLLSEYCPTVFWTSSTATHVTMKGSAAGTFIFPAADVRWDATSCGWLVCNYAEGKSGEWHNLYKDMPEYHIIPHPDDLKTSLKIKKLWRDENNDPTDAPGNVDSIEVDVRRKLAAPTGEYYKIEIYVSYNNNGAWIDNLTKVVYVKKTGSAADSVDIEISDTIPERVYNAGNVYKNNENIDIVLSEDCRRIHLDNLADKATSDGTVGIRISGAVDAGNTIVGYIQSYISVPEDKYTAADFAVPTGTEPDSYKVEKTLSSSNNWEAEITDLDKSVDTVDDYYDSNWEDKLGYLWFYYIEEDITSAEGFEVSYDNNGINYGVITVTNRKPGTSITVSKKWVDDSDDEDDGDNHSDQIVVEVYKVLTPVVSANETNHTGSADVLRGASTAELEAETAVKTRSEDGEKKLKFQLDIYNPYTNKYDNISPFALDYSFLENKQFTITVKITTSGPINASELVSKFWCDYPNVFDSATNQNTSNLSYSMTNIGENEYEVVISNILIASSYAEPEKVYSFNLQLPWNVTGVTSCEISGEGVISTPEPPSGGDTGIPGGNGGSNQGSNGGGSNGSGGNSNNSNYNNSNGTNDTTLTAQSTDNSNGIIDGNGSGGGNSNPSGNGGTGTDQDQDDDTVIPGENNPNPQAPVGQSPQRGENGGLQTTPNESNTAGSLPRSVKVKEITLTKGHWSETLDHLPVREYAKNADGEDVLCNCSYYVVEKEVPDGYEVSYSTGSNESNAVTEGTITITNTKLGKLVIYKKTTGARNTPPEDAKFHITGPEGFTPIDIRYKDFVNYELTDQEVTPYYEITNLKPGNYKVEENTGRDEIGGALYFGDDDDGSKYQLTVTYSSTDEKTDGTTQIALGGTSEIEIENEYWTSYAMPATGGEGRRWIYLMSITLIALAGVGLVMVRRRRELLMGAKNMH